MLYKFIESVKSSRIKGSKFKRTPDPRKVEFNQHLADIMAGKNPSPLD